MTASQREAGVTVVTDTCTYITPVIGDGGPVMTDSAKWAWYAPGTWASRSRSPALDDACSGVEGRLVRDEGPWGD